MDLPDNLLLHCYSVVLTQSEYTVSLSLVSVQQIHGYSSLLIMSMEKFDQA